MSVECQFEAEVLSAVLHGRWPHSADRVLLQHVAGCKICSEVAAIAATFDSAQHDPPPTLPDSGRVWWLAQLRARREAVRAANRPILVTQIMGFAWAIGLIVTCLGAALAWFQSSSQEIKTLLVSATSLAAEHAAILLCAATLVLLLPAAAYLALGRD
jgi:predicted anti-sigma-YlaC factor YlaD